jgi:hypothetical protein
MTESEYPEFDEAIRNTVSRVEMQQIKKDKGFVQASRFRLEDQNQLARSSRSSVNIKRSESSWKKGSPTRKKPDGATDLIVEDLANDNSEEIEDGISELRIDTRKKSSPTYPRKNTSPNHSRGGLRRMKTNGELHNSDFAPLKDGSPTKFGTKGIQNDAVAHTKFPLLDRALSIPQVPKSSPQFTDERLRSDQSPMITPIT